MNLRVFISSHGGVDTERKITGCVLARTAAGFRARLELETYFREDKPMVQHCTLQEKLPAMAIFDLILCVPWSLLDALLAGRDGGVRAFPE